MIDKLSNQHANDYRQLVSQISDTFVRGQKQSALAVNTHLVKTYWKVGRYIVEYEQNGNDRAVYGNKLLENLSKDLTLLHGKGFGLSNIYRMRQFYLVFPILAKPSQETGAEPAYLLSWSHYVELLKIDDPLERSFYEKQTLLEHWSVPELKRQKKSSLYLRLAASRDKEGILELAKQGLIVQKPADLIREPYVLDFLQIPEPYHISESEMETAIINCLQHFMLELGKGFAFVGRQYRIVLNNVPHRIDLVFYNYYLKCFVLIDLKHEEASYQDVGQMNMYLGYFAKEENPAGDNPPIGIILSREKDEIMIEYATYEMNSQLFVAKYQFYLPDKEDLKRIVNSQLKSENQ
jgi:predicted nuclease of restriction endonuclease-like (RecB) superfamily